MSLPLLAIAAAPIDDGGAAWGVLALALALVLLNGFFVAAEFALVKVRATHLEADKETRRGRLALSMIDNLDGYLSASQLGITLSSLGLGWIGEPAFAWLLEPLLRAVNAPEQLLRPVSLVTAFATITLLHVVIGEQAPRSLAIRKPRRTAMTASIPLYLFYKITYPAIWLLNGLSNQFLRLVGIEPPRGHELAPSEEEIRSILASDEQSKITPEKRELLDNVFELSDRIARQVMVPRSEVVYLDVDLPMEENLQRARESGHTRFPLCQGDLDHIIGLVHIKDLFRAVSPPRSLLDVRRDTFFVPETLSLDSLLRRMRSARIHMCAVLDEYGGISGIVTLENIIEEIVGEIQDEFDYERPDVIRVAEGTYQVLGSTLIQDLEDELEVELGAEEREEDTVAGIVLSEIGRRARVGDRVTVGPLTLEVREVDHNRITSLRATVVESEPPQVVEA
jgi:CBS domain containing-hemolysin-like protein